MGRLADALAFVRRFCGRKRKHQAAEIMARHFGAIMWSTVRLGCDRLRCSPVADILIRSGRLFEVSTRRSGVREPNGQVGPEFWR